jgi:transcriptional regulator GlxA family with amidase domain
MQRQVLSAFTFAPLFINTSRTLNEIQDARVRTIVALIQDKCERPFTLTHFAEAVNLTPEYFCRIFTRQMGIAPLKYLKLFRLQSARQLLEDSHLTVKQIMFAVGFSDESHFVRDFENQFGLSPVRYREFQTKLSPSLLQCQDLPTEVKNGQ